MLIDTISLELFSHTDLWKENGQIFLHEGFFMLRGFALHGRQFLLPSQPYLLQEGRVVLVRQGEASYTFNLEGHRFEAGDLVVFSGNTLVEKQYHSPDFLFDAFNFPLPAGTDVDRPSYVRLRLDEHTRPVVCGHMELLWQLVCSESQFPAANVRLLTESLLDYVASRQCQPVSPPTASRRDDLLRRFVGLVSRHAARERSIPFYADRLCVAPHYLSTLVKQVSGRTVMEWVTETAVKEIKVWLAYSDETAAQIADRLGFACPSSLTKFFKRATGLTPSEYRLGVAHKSGGSAATALDM